MKRRVWALITGTIRIDLYFRIAMIRLCDLRARGVIEKIIFSTWDDEIDKIHGLRKELKELGIILVETPYIDEFVTGKFNGVGYLSYERQREVIANGIKKIPNDVFVLKLRTDGDRGIDSIIDFIEKDKDIDVKPYGAFPMVFDSKLVIRFINFRHMLYGYDQYYLASKAALNKITLPFSFTKTSDIPICTETRTLCGYSYVFYELLREIWNIIPGDFYDKLWAYCRNHEEKDLVLPRLVHRIFATVCVYMYTQVHLAGDDGETIGPVKLIDLFSDKIRTNNQIENIVFGNVVDSQLSYVFKDELRKVSLYLPEVRSYTYDEYVELRGFCETELKNKNLIRAYPYVGDMRADCDITFISNDENDALACNSKILQVSVKAKNTNHNSFRFDLEKNHRYTIKIRGIQSTTERYTAGVFDFSHNKIVKYEDFSVSESVCFNFVTGENIGRSSFLIYAGICGKTYGEELMVNEFEVASKEIKVDKQYAGEIMLKKFSNVVDRNKLISFIDDRFNFDGWKLYLCMRSIKEEGRKMTNEILKLSTYDRNPAALSEYAARLRVQPDFYDYETFAHNFKFLGSIFNGYKAELIVAIYDYLVNYHTFLPIHGMGTRWYMLNSINNLMGMVNEKYPKLAEVPSVYKFQMILVASLYEQMGTEKISPANLVLIKALLSIASKSPFSSSVIRKMKDEGYDELVEVIEGKWADNDFELGDWLISNSLKEVLESRDNQRIIEYAANIKSFADAQGFLDYLGPVFLDLTPEIRDKAYAVLEKLALLFVEPPFLVKVSRFLRTNNMIVSNADMADNVNFIILLEMLYKKNMIRLQYESLMKMCFHADWRELFLCVFKRIEHDARLSLLGVKKCAEIWFHYVAYLEDERSKDVKVAIDGEGRSWPFMERRNASSFAGFIRLHGQGLFLCVELCAGDRQKTYSLVEKAGFNIDGKCFDINGQRGNLIRLITHQIDYDGLDQMQKSVDMALDEFCRVGERLVMALHV